MHIHILQFPTEAAAKAALSDYVSDAQWDGSRVVSGLRIVHARAEWGGDPEAPTMTTPEDAEPGYILAVIEPADVPALRDRSECLRVIDGAGAAIYTKSGLDMTRLRASAIDGWLAGVQHPFGP